MLVFLLLLMAGPMMAQSNTSDSVAGLCEDVPLGRRNLCWEIDTNENCLRPAPCAGTEPNWDKPPEECPSHSYAWSPDREPGGGFVCVPQAIKPQPFGDQIRYAILIQQKQQTLLQRDAQTIYTEWLRTQNGVRYLSLLDKLREVSLELDRLYEAARLHCEAAGLAFQSEGVVCEAKPNILQQITGGKK